MTNRSAVIAAAFLVAQLGVRAEAGVVITVEQVGANVVTTGSGTLNLASLSGDGPTSDNAKIEPFSADVIVGITSAGIDFYRGITGPSSFGTGGLVEATGGSGDTFGLDSIFLIVPDGYQSGGKLFGTSYYENTTLAALGVTPGSYTWTWGTGADADFLTVNITSVPEPSTLALAGVAGAIGLGAVRLRRRD